MSDKLWGKIFFGKYGNKTRILWLLLFIIAGLIIRFYFARIIAFTNDEGAYLYDAKSLLSGRLPGGDFIVKSPVSALVFTFFVWMTGGSLYANRIAAICMGIFSLAPLAILLKIWKNDLRIFAFVAWLTFSGPVLLLGMGNTEAVASFFAMTSLTTFIISQKNKNNNWLSLFSGLLFVLAFSARKTNLALIVPMLVVSWQYWSGTRRWVSSFLYFVFGFFGALVVIVAGLLRLYGPNGLDAFFGVGYLSLAGEKIFGTQDINIWGIHPLETLQILSRVATSHVVLGIFFMLIFTLLFFIRGPKHITRRPYFVIFSWNVSLFILYLFWPVFLPDYAADFLMPITIFSVLIMGELWNKYGIIGKVFFVGCFVVVNCLSFISVAQKPWTGMFTETAVRSMAIKLKQDVPQDEPILTAAVIVPYLSGHSTFLDISHPLWYRYNFISEKEKGVFLPDWESVSEIIKNGKVRWMVFEHLTDYSYFRNADQLISLLGDWKISLIVENSTGFRSNTLRLYSRK